MWLQGDVVTYFQNLFFLYGALKLWYDYHFSVNNLLRGLVTPCVIKLWLHPWFVKKLWFTKQNVYTLFLVWITLVNLWRIRLESSDLSVTDHVCFSTGKGIVVMWRKCGYSQNSISIFSDTFIETDSSEKLCTSFSIILSLQSNRQGKVKH